MSLADYFRRILIAEDRVGDAVLGGPDDQTMSQSLGLHVLAGDWWAKPISAILDYLTNERHHAVRSLYDDATGSPIFPSRMPPSVASSNPHPGPARSPWAQLLGHG